MAPSGGASGIPYSSPPSVKGVSRLAVVGLIHRLVGLLFTVSLCILVVCVIPLIIIVRIIGYVKRKSRRWQYERRVCSQHWCLSGSGADVGCMFLEGPVAVEQINEFVNTVLTKDQYGLSKAIQEEDGRICRVWNQSEHRLRNEADLARVLNDPSAFDSERATVRIVNKYYCSKRDVYGTLIVLSNPSRNDNLCIPRFINILSNKKMYLEVIQTEPLHCYNLFLVRQATLFTSIVNSTYEFLTEGPVSLLSCALRVRSPVWRCLEGKEHTAPVVNRRGLVQFSRDESSSVLMESIPEEVVVVPKDEPAADTATAQGNSSIVRELPLPYTRRQLWRVVPSGELIGRAERVLRSTSCEMMITLLAGALRTYCRHQGLLQPPDLGFVIPVACRNFLPIACEYPCNSALIPLMLPTGVEGTIPRLWTLQRRLYQGLHGHLPSTVKIAELFARTCFSTCSASSMLRPLYTSQAIYIAYYRVAGDAKFKISSHLGLMSMSIFPSLSDSIKAAFVFVQTDEETKLCASLCKKTFPQPEALLSIFEDEIRQLVSHLSLRLMSLPQSTILPAPAFRKTPEPAEDDRVLFGSTYLREKTSELDEGEKSEGEYSLEELLRLLATVQTELDGMRANPQGDRAEYIKKLTALEERMQRFHQCITSRLGNDGVVMTSSDDEETTTELVENILAPYKDGPDSSRHRRFSREFLRTEEKAAERKTSN